MLLAHVVTYNLPAVPDELRRLGEAIDAPEDPAGAIAGLVSRLGLPSGLGECGVTLEDIDAVARMSQGHRGVQNNPRPVSEDDARAILAAAF
jgi:alcohol dehydrogenase class IV